MLVLKTCAYRNSIHIAGLTMCAAGIATFVTASSIGYTIMSTLIDVLAMDDAA